MMRESSENILFRLLRAALGNETVVSLPETVDWNAVVDMAFNQSVAAIAVDGLQKRLEVRGERLESLELRGEGLENDLLESEALEDLRYDLFGEALACEDDYQKYKAAIADFLKLCRSEQIRVLLLKGYGLSLNYPVPSHRPCGDVDVFVIADKSRLGVRGERLGINDLMRKRGIEVNEGNPHHSVFSFGGFTFENHNTLVDVERHRNHLSDERIFQQLIDEGCDEIEVDGVPCLVPSVKLNSVYLLRHSAHHFSVEKITLRHILDWALFVKANAARIDWDFVYGYARETGCGKFLNCLNGICTEALGFAAEDFPVRTVDPKLQARMLSDILSPEFKEEIPDTSHKLRYAIAKTRRILANRWKYRMVSDECLLVTFGNLAKNRL